MTRRSSYKAASNNSDNRCKNICALAVVSALGLENTVRYLHTYEDVKRACRNSFSVRSVKSMVKSKTAGGARKMMSELGAKYYIVWVDGHVLMMDALGKTIVDTAPRLRDRRKIVQIHGLYT